MPQLSLAEGETQGILPDCNSQHASLHAACCIHMAVQNDCSLQFDLFILLRNVLNCFVVKTAVLTDCTTCMPIGKGGKLMNAVFI